jgi:hypothetical protein
LKERRKKLGTKKRQKPLIIEQSFPTGNSGESEKSENPISDDNGNKQHLGEKVRWMMDLA